VVLNRRKWIIKNITVYQQQNFLKNITNLRFWILKECPTAGGKFLDDNFSDVNLLLVLIIIYISMQF
jgi:hypothetical protein